MQAAAQVLVSRDADFAHVIFDSGKIDGSGIDSVAYRPPIMLDVTIPFNAGRYTIDYPIQEN